MNNQAPNRATIDSVREAARAGKDLSGVDAKALEQMLSDIEEDFEDIKESMAGIKVLSEDW